MYVSSTAPYSSAPWKFCNTQVRSQLFLRDIVVLVGDVSCSLSQLLTWFVFLGDSMPMNGTRRHFLQITAGAAALSLTASARTVGNTHILQVAANFPAPPGPDRLPVEWYRRKIKQVQAKMVERNLDA